jgi:uncharacterized protein YktB (UPF0637 family)
VGNIGFTPTDFEVFAVDGFNERMQAIYAHVRPKLIKLGDELAPMLARKMHMEFFPQTWAAFGPSPKGYKRYGYLALCISGAGLHARAVVKAEADKRAEMALSLKSRAAHLAKEFRGTKIARYDKWDFHQLPAPQPADEELFTSLAEGLGKKTGGLDIGFGWNVKQSLKLERDELIEAFQELGPIYRLLRAVV